MAELLRKNKKECKEILEDDAFHLVCNKQTIKVKTSLATKEPCPSKHIGDFSIIGHKTSGEKIFDYYAQIVFCSAPVIGNDKEFKISMFFVGFVHNSQLTEIKVFSKHAYKSGHNLRVFGGSRLSDSNKPSFKCCNELTKTSKILFEGKV